MNKKDDDIASLSFYYEEIIRVLGYTRSNRNKRRLTLWKIIIMKH